jgi:putative intracellular protease/amidase
MAIRNVFLIIDIEFGYWRERPYISPYRHILKVVIPLIISPRRLTSRHLPENQYQDFEKEKIMRLSIVLFDGFTALDIVGGYEVLANLPGVETEFISASTGLVVADTRRLALLGYRSFSQTESTDILYIPGGPGVFNGLNDHDLIDTIARLHASSRWTLGICNGVELLGAAGCLEGKEVTTNWFARERVAAYGAKVQTSRYHRDGKLITGAGVSASIDAGLYLAGVIAGEEIALTIQLGIEYYPAPPFGNGTPEDASPSARAFVRMFEESSVERLAQLKTTLSNSSIFKKWAPIS